MTRSFADLSAEIRASWDEDARSVYDAASHAFAAEVAARVALGQQLTRARHEQGFTQRALAERSNVQQAEISRIERGVANPTASTLARIAGALDRSLTLSPRH